ncbi:MAG: hypothetical protein H7A46_01395 [Verrucomicrobiales bacterium]|nr:hypothetical protein [Verrucomicrobiales bacterium]
MQIPTEDDWWDDPEGFADLDVRHAYEMFHGKNLEEALALFVDHAMDREEDLLFMPATCLRYYIQAYITYLRSNASRGDADGASAFIGLIEGRSDDLRGSAQELIDEVSATLLYLRGCQEWFEADPEIYGSFGSRALTVLAKIQPNKTQ